MNLLQNLHLEHRGRRAVPLQTFFTRHSNRKLSIVMALLCQPLLRNVPVNYQIRQNNAK